MKKLVFIIILLFHHLLPAQQLPGTQPLIWSGDIASQLIDSCDAFLLREIDSSMVRRVKYWERDITTPAAYQKSTDKNREVLAGIIGVRDERISNSRPALISRVAKGNGYYVNEVRWPVLGNVFSEGLYVEPEFPNKKYGVIVIPDADQTPEDLLGITGSLPAHLQTARVFAEKGIRVLIPALINRQPGHKQISNRELVYRPSFEMGRHIIGYEVQKILAGVDWFSSLKTENIVVSGWGEGGLLALYAGAIDTRITEVHSGGYFGNRQDVWQEPAYRNVMGLLTQFGDAEIASLIAPRKLVLYAENDAPALVIPPGTGGKPGRIIISKPEDVEAELDRLATMTRGLQWKVSRQKPVTPKDGWTSVINLPDAEARHQRLKEQIEQHTQWLMSEGPYTRKKFMADLNTETPGTLMKSAEKYKTYFENQVIGKFDYPLLSPNARTRKIDIGNSMVTAYEVVLDVFDGLFAYGILMVPNDIKDGEKRPVVVCQHGLEGRPQSTTGEEGYHYYKAFSTRLAEKGYITFAPQNIYIFNDRFRTLQFKANAIGKTLFSMMVPQHRQITNWLGSLPMVDKERMGFYGLSYGGKSAMRIPPLVDAYSVVVCSADFNDWIWKTTSTRSPFSYVWTNEYEIFEWDLGNTFNYAEMAALIAPRPFMVERGHFDGVAPDETVAYEYAKVRYLYAALLKMEDRTAIEWFDGPHTINGKGTFEFLDRHLGGGR